jgi:hypothetical protein
MSDAGGGARIATPGARALLALGVVVAAGSVLVRLGDMDLFSHAAVGRWILAHGAVPRTDPFSYASAGPFRYTEALADVIFAWIDRASGAVGLSLFQVVDAIALLALVLARARGSPASRVLLAALVVTSSFAAMALKPQVFSYLCFAALLLAIDRLPKRDPRAALAIPLLFVAWANLHRAGVFGVVALGAACVGFALDPATRRHATWLAIATALSGAALLASPGGAYYVTSAFDVATRASFHEHLSEWRPLTWATIRERHLAIVPLVALALGERAARRRRVDPELLVLFASMAVATRGARLLPFVAIAAAAPAARALDALVDAASRAARPALSRALVAVLGLALPVVHYARAVPPAFRGLGVCEAVQPVDLARFFQEHRPPGHLFHPFDFGGYLLYALAPETKVLVDGRNDTVYDDAFFTQVLAAEADPGAFAALDRRFAFSVAAFGWDQVGDPRGAFLERDPRWTLVYWDDLSVVYANGERAGAFASALGYRELRPSTAAARAAQPGGDARDADFVNELRRNAREAPRSARAHYLLAIALAARGAEDEARREAALVGALAASKGLPIEPPAI